MINFIKNLFRKEVEVFTGVLGNGEYTKLVHFDEMVASSAQPLFSVKNTSQWKQYPYQYQDGSSACVAYTIAKIACVLYKNLTGNVVKFSPAYYYVRRANKHQEGMGFANAVDLAKDGAVVHDLLPCEGMSEKDINLIEIKEYHHNVADAFEFPDNWVDLPANFDTVAATLEVTGKAVMLWFTFSAGEFFNLSTPKVLNSKNMWRHSVTAVDAFTYNGVHYILIEDSASVENVYRKLITKDFFDKKCVLARYPINFKFAVGKAIYDGTTKSLQDCLKSIALFPSNVESTGVFGSVTKNAVKLFQKKYSLKDTGVLDKATYDKIKELFS